MINQVVIPDWINKETLRNKDQIKIDRNFQNQTKDILDGILSNAKKGDTYYRRQITCVFYNQLNNSGFISDLRRRGLNVYFYLYDPPNNYRGSLLISWDEESSDE